jgi:hypothetical protein
LDISSDNSSGVINYSGTFSFEQKKYVLYDESQRKICELEADKKARYVSITIGIR